MYEFKSKLNTRSKDIMLYENILIKAQIKRKTDKERENS